MGGNDAVGGRSTPTSPFVGFHKSKTHERVREGVHGASAVDGRRTACTRRP